MLKYMQVQSAPACIVCTVQTIDKKQSRKTTQKPQTVQNLRILAGKIKFLIPQKDY